MKEVKLLMRWKRRLELLHFRYKLKRFSILETTLNQFQYRAEMLGSVRQQQSRLAKLRGELQKANRGMNRAPGEGSRDRAGGGQAGPPDQYRQQVLAGKRVLERTGDSLARAQQVFVKHSCL